MTIRVLIADDHALFAHALAERIAQQYEVVDIVGDGKALLDSARKHRPDVIVADITMPHMSGLESVRLLLKDVYQPKIIFVTMHADVELARECFNCGASAFVSKESGYDELMIAIDTVIANHPYVSPRIAGLADVFKHPAALDKTFLTARQREILQLFGEGKTMKE